MIKNIHEIYLTEPNERKKIKILRERKRTVTLINSSNNQMKCTN